MQTRQRRQQQPSPEGSKARQKREREQSRRQQRKQSTGIDRTATIPQVQVQYVCVLRSSLLSFAPRSASFVYLTLALAPLLTSPAQLVCMCELATWRAGAQTTMTIIGGDAPRRRRKGHPFICCCSALLFARRRSKSSPSPSPPSVRGSRLPPPPHLLLFLPACLFVAGAACKQLCAPAEPTAASRHWQRRQPVVCATLSRTHQPTAAPL